MNEILERLRSLDRTRLIALGGIFLVVLAALILSAFYFTRPSYEVLYAQLEPAEGSRVVNALEEMGVSSRISDGGGTVLVPAGRVAQTRMALAAQGLPSSGGPGYSLFDDQGSLGMTSFMQQINRLRALQGELASTIETLEGVRAARVMLVLPEREAFAREVAQPSGSVVLRLDEGATLDRQQARAIQHLVASSVAELEPRRVTVMDSTLQALFTEETGDSALAAAAGEMRSQVEADIVRKIESLLFPRLGRQNVRVRVTAELDLDREVIREQLFDPDEQVVRSSQTIEERESSTEPAGGDAVTVQQNLPEEEVDAAEQGLALSNLTRSEEVVNYEISNVARETTREPGSIERLTVAVLVNGTYATDEEGNRTYVPRPDDEMNQISQLVRAAAGVDARPVDDGGRGDVVTVANLEFVEQDLDIAPVGPTGVTKVLSDNLMTIIQWLVLLAIVALLVIFGLRPVLDRLLPPPPSIDEADDEERAALAALTQPALQGPGIEGGIPGVAPALGEGMPGMGPQIVPRAPIDETLDQMIELRAVEGKVRASSLLKLSRIVDDNPDEVVAILRSWIYEDAA